jgi:hypothetical protein
MGNLVTEGIAGWIDGQGEGFTDAGQLRAFQHCHIDDMKKQELSSDRITQLDRVPDGNP